MSYSLSKNTALPGSPDDPALRKMGFGAQGSILAFLKQKQHMVS